ncbi:MAG: DUF6580 family putative transport protein [Bryobacteraceae bacterium]|jgi:hypothetical protein
MQNQTQSRPLAFGLTVLSALGRLVPHAPNVTPLGGSCLFAGSRISGLWAYLLPLVVMIATDPFVGHAGGASGGYTFGSPAIYACFLINVFIGRRMLRRVTPVRVGLAAFLCSLQFFVLTNLALWISAVAQHNPIYSPDLKGLLTCYTLALPFWGRTLAGDLLFSGALFGMYELLSRRTAASKEPVTV